MVSVDVSELQVLAADMQRNADLVEPAAKRVIARTGFAVVATAQALVPVDTGLLKSSLNVDVDGLSFEAGTGIEYGEYVELGTSEMAPQPYLGPAFDQHERSAADALGDIGERILR